MRAAIRRASDRYRYEAVISHLVSLGGSGTLSLAAKKDVPTSTRQDPHPIRDFLVAEVIDHAPKDHTDMMERPFFSIAKRKRLKPIDNRSEARPLRFHPDFAWRVASTEYQRPFCGYPP
jgi:hypothetical protein